MQRFGLDINQLYIISANTLLEFVTILILNQPNNQIQRLIHEKIFITNFLTTLSEHKNKHHLKNDDKDVYPLAPGAAHTE